MHVNDVARPPDTAHLSFYCLVTIYCHVAQEWVVFDLCTFYVRLSMPTSTWYLTRSVTGCVCVCVCVRVYTYVCPLGAKNKSQPPLKASRLIARAEGKCSRHKGWWREGKDELATHSMTTESWISSRGKISEATCTALQEALEEDEKKDTPSFGKEDLEEIHRSGRSEEHTSELQSR